MCIDVCGRYRSQVDAVGHQAAMCHEQSLRWHLHRPSTNTGAAPHHAVCSTGAGAVWRSAACRLRERGRGERVSRVPAHERIPPQAGHNALLDVAIKLLRVPSGLNTSS
jgi:hypothetical protein